MRMSEVRIDTHTGALRVTEMDATLHSEFCRIRDDLVATDSVRFGYAGWMEGGKDFNFRGLSKWDLKSRRLVATIRYPEEVVGEEPVFVPYGGTGCDDGFIATVCIHQRLRRADLVFFDAKSFREQPVARVRLPVRVPHGFHGLWLSEEQLRWHLLASARPPPPSPS
jgi:carotenoid cleavage dioxygenase-like enzyme